MNVSSGRQLGWTTYTIDNKDARSEATPATIIVARVNFCPVPPERPTIIAARKWVSYPMTR